MGPGLGKGAHPPSPRGRWAVVGAIETVLGGLLTSWPATEAETSPNWLYSPPNNLSPRIVGMLLFWKYLELPPTLLVRERGKLRCEGRILSVQMPRWMDGQELYRRCELLIISQIGGAQGHEVFDAKSDNFNGNGKGEKGRRQRKGR